MANDNQTALMMSIQRKKDRMKALELDLLGHHIFGGREAAKQEVQFLKHEITEDEKLLAVEREKLCGAFFDGRFPQYQTKTMHEWYELKYGTDGK